MATENGLAVFSLRLPKVLADRIDQRAKTHRRNRNAEIILLLEQAINLLEIRDKAMANLEKQEQETLRATS